MTAAVRTGEVEAGRAALPALSHFVLVIAAVKAGVLLGATATGGYGYIRDELYYLACSDHLSWGYVDHPPLSIALLWLSRHVFGDSLAALRLVPALSGAVVVVLAALLTRQLGGGHKAQVMASSCVVAAPLLLGTDATFSMNAFDVLLWTAGIYLFVVASESGRERDWVWLGLVLGLGLLNKLSVLWLVAGLFAGIVVRPARRLLLTRRPWVAAAVAAVLFLPHVAWQVSNGYPTLEFIRNASSGKYVALLPLDLFVQQSVFMNPVTLPIWVAGVLYALVSKSGRALRGLAVVYLVVFAILAANGNSKATYFVTLLPMLFVLGGLAFERLADRVRWRLFTPTVAGLVLLTGAALAPMVVSVLPVGWYLRYAAALGVAPSTSENHRLGRLPQHFADMFGWPELADAVATAYGRLDAGERSRCAILCGNYGEAGAVDFFGPARGLPKAISGHNSYWLWGTRGASGDLVIVLGRKRDDLEKAYRDVVLGSVARNAYSMPYESDLPIWICRGRRTSLTADWGQFKVFN
jgi:hypothetical protein